MGAHIRGQANQTRTSVIGFDLTGCLTSLNGRAFCAHLYVEGYVNELVYIQLTKKTTLARNEILTHDLLHLSHFRGCVVVVKMKLSVAALALTIGSAAAFSGSR